jgi:hypothetical protein
MGCCCLKGNSTLFVYNRGEWHKTLFVAVFCSLTLQKMVKKQLILKQIIYFCIENKIRQFLSPLFLIKIPVINKFNL